MIDNLINASILISVIALLLYSLYCVVELIFDFRKKSFMITTSAGVREDLNDLYDPIHTHEVFRDPDGNPQTMYVQVNGVYHNHDIIPGQVETGRDLDHYHTIRLERLNKKPII